MSLKNYSRRFRNWSQVGFWSLIRIDAAVGVKFLLHYNTKWLYRGTATEVAHFREKFSHLDNRWMCNILELFLGILDPLNTLVLLFFESDAGKWTFYMPELGCSIEHLCYRKC